MVSTEVCFEDSSRHQSLGRHRDRFGCKKFDRRLSVLRETLAEG